MLINEKKCPSNRDVDFSFNTLSVASGSDELELKINETIRLWDFKRILKF